MTGEHGSCLINILARLKGCGLQQFPVVLPDLLLPAGRRCAAFAAGASGARYSRTIFVLPGPAACQFNFQGKAEEGTDDHDNGQNTNRCEGQFYGDRMNNVGSNQKFEAQQNTSPQTMTDGAKNGFCIGSPDHVNDGIKQGVERNSDNDTDANHFNERGRPLGQRFYKFRHDVSPCGKSADSGKTPAINVPYRNGHVWSGLVWFASDLDWRKASPFPLYASRPYTKFG
jgi:hypothetical protein